MPVLQHHARQHPLAPGETLIGSDPDAQLRLDAPGIAPRAAIVALDTDGHAVVSRVDPGADVRVNGVPLGIEPLPLLHGDRVELGGETVLFADDRKGGATQVVSGDEIAALAAKRAGPARATLATGGRLVSLVDGKEYTVPDAGLVIGREAGCDVVVAQSEVSRRHAQIAPDDEGYALTDLSANGVWVNGVRVQSTQRLFRADVVRIGGEEFRFYADVAATGGRPTPPATPEQVPALAPTGMMPAFRREDLVAGAAAAAAASAGSTSMTGGDPEVVAGRPTPAFPSAPVPAAPTPIVAQPGVTSVPTAPEPKKGGIPGWVWVAIVLVLGAAVYFVIQGR